jgi:hypothetical protein
MPGPNIEELLQAYKDAVTAYRAAVDAMVIARTQGKSLAERRQLEEVVDAARERCEACHVAVVTHQFHAKE